MKLAYFDCFSGISGDMTLGALLHAGVPLEQLREELSGLAVPGWEIRAEKVWKNGMAATYVRVQTQETHAHRSLSTIEGILQKSTLANHVRARRRHFSQTRRGRSRRPRRAHRKNPFP